MKFTQPVPSCNTPISLIVATNANNEAAVEVVAAEKPLDQAQPPDNIIIKQEEKETPKPESRPKV